MKWYQATRWLLLSLLVGCNAKLQLESAAAGAAGNAGNAGNAEAGGSDASGSAGDGLIAGDSSVDPPAPCCSAAGAGGAGAAAGAGGAGAAGAAGGPLIAPAPGQRGQKCIPGGTNTEAAGTPGKATIVTLDRCNDGLACDTTKHCSSIPDCPQASGVCVVYGTPVVEDTGTGGAGGTAGTSNGNNGLAGGSGITMAESGIVQLAANDTHLYWVEYGTRDDLGNYQHDGALRDYDIASAKATTLAGNLPGPVALGITSQHAYVGVDGGTLIGAPARPQLLRLLLSGGATEVVQDAEVGGFTAAGDQAYWTTSSGPGKPSASIYTVAPSGTGAPMQIREASYTLYLQADDTDLYFVGPYGGKGVIVRQSQTGASSAATQVASQPYIFGLSADSVYGVEDGMVLDQVPKTGGEWTRKRALGAGGNPELVQIIGDRYFVAAHPDYPNDYSKAMVLTGLLSSNAPPLRLVETSIRRPNWQFTAKAVFWTDGKAIFSRAVTDE